MTVKLTKTDEKTIRSILASCQFNVRLPMLWLTMFVDKLHNCDVMIREDVSICSPFIAIRANPFEKITTDEFIDVLIGTRKYIPCLCMYPSTLYRVQSLL